MNSERSCFCNECFYCFMKNDIDTNLNKLSAIQLRINVAEYVPPEMGEPKFKKKSSRLLDIPIQICTSAHNE